MIKKLFVLVAALCLLCSCATNADQSRSAGENLNKTVGISLPDLTWGDHATQLTRQLEKAGYQVFVEYAGGDMQLQYSQVQTLVNMPVGCLVVAAVDSMALGDVLSANVPVIAFDRMLMYTDAVTGCVGLDSYAAGQLAGQHIAQEKQLETAQAPVSIEFFMGAPENHNSFLFYQGVMSQLQPYLHSGVLQCRSGRTAFEDACIQPETVEMASDRCFDYLTSYYEQDAPDVLCAATDALANGCINALTSFALEPSAEDWPLITGAGATEEGLQNLADGYQSITVHTDGNALVEQCVLRVQAAVEGKPLADGTAFNGVADVPACLLEPTLVDKDNYKDFLPEE